MHLVREYRHNGFIACQQIPREIHSKIFLLVKKIIPGNSLPG